VLARFASRAKGQRRCYGFVPLVMHAPPPHFRFEEVVTAVVLLFGTMTGGLCFAAPAVSPAVPLPIELPVTAPPAEVGFVTLPTVAGFVTVEAGVAAPPITGAGLEAPPIVFCFVFAGPPSAFWASEGFATDSESAPIDIPSTIVLIMALFFISAIFPCRREDISASSAIPHPCREPRISLSQPMEM
jgi:hypothetical protein